MRPVCCLCAGVSFTEYRANDLRCDSCSAQARTRMMGLALMRAAPPPNGHPVAHIAPERGLVPFLRGRYGEAYRPMDFNTERYKKVWLFNKVDFVDLSRPAEFLPPNSLQGLVHVHVIEHVPAPIDAVLSQMNDAVAPGGFHAFIVPGMADYYEEDLSSTPSPQERKERYGHPEHMRIFGREDWADVVLKHFEGWTQVDLKSLISLKELELAAIPVATFKRLTGKTVHMFIKN